MLIEQSLKELAHLLLPPDAAAASAQVQTYESDWVDELLPYLKSGLMELYG